MLKYTFLHAFALLALGVVGALGAEDAGELRAFAIPGIFFGGAILFCAFFALKEPRHGMAGAAFLSFLVVLTNGWSVFNTIFRGSYDPSRTGHLVAGGVFLLSVFYLALSAAIWKHRRKAAALAELEGS